MSAAVQACQDTLPSNIKEGTKPGQDNSKNWADSQGGGSQVAYAPPAARTLLEIREFNVQHHLKTPNPLV